LKAAHLAVVDRIYRGIMCGSLPNVYHIPEASRLNIDMQLVTVGRKWGARLI
jgi:hypothetical protein